MAPHVRRVPLSLLGLLLCVLHSASTLQLGGLRSAFVPTSVPSARASLTRQCAIAARGPQVLLAKGLGLLDRTQKDGVASLECRVVTKVGEYEYEGSIGTSSLTRRSSEELPATTEDDTLVAIMLQQAKALEREGDRSGAAQMYEAIVGKHPENGKVWMKLFLLCKNAQDFGEARSVLQRALVKLPGNAILWQAWADMEWHLYKPAVARNLYKKGLEANPHLPSLYNAWGGMERALGNVKRARELFVQGLKKNPGSARLLFSLAILEDVEGNTKLAEKLLRQGMGQEPNNPHLLHAMGVLEYKRVQVPAARAMFERCLREDKTFTRAWLSWGRMEEEVGFMAIAREKYQQGCKTNNGRGAVQLWQSWARLEEKAGETHRAIDVYKRAVALYPKDPSLLLEWGKLEEKRGEINTAHSLFKRAISAAPNRPYAYQCLAVLEARQQRFDNARGLFETGIRKAEKERKRGKMVHKAKRTLTQEVNEDLQLGRREDANLLHAWAKMEAKLQNFNRTRELFSRAVELDNTQGWLWQSYARFEGVHGDEWLCRHYFAQAVNCAPRDPRTWRYWGEFEESRGNADRARVYGQRALQLSYSHDVEQSLPDSAKPLLRRWIKARNIRDEDEDEEAYEEDEEEIEVFDDVPAAQ